MWQGVLHAAQEQNCKVLSLSAIGLGAFLDPTWDESQKKQVAELYYGELLKLLSQPEYQGKFDAIYVNPVFPFAKNALQEAQERSPQAAPIIHPFDGDVKFLAIEFAKNDIRCALLNPSDPDVMWGTNDVGEYYKKGHYAGEEDIGATSTAALGSAGISDVYRNEAKITNTVTPDVTVRAVIQAAFDENITSRPLDDNEKNTIIRYLQNTLSRSLYEKIVSKYHLSHLDQSMSLNDVRAILVGVATNTTAKDLENAPKLNEFLATNQANIIALGERERQSLAKHMDDIKLQQMHPLKAFTLKAGQWLSQKVVKANDLKDAFAGVQINRAFEKDIKTLATVDYAKTYSNNEQQTLDAFHGSVTNESEQHKFKSQLYLATDMAYRDLNNGAVLPILDEDGKTRLYQAVNLVHDKGFVATALVPYEVDDTAPTADIKILFRGTHSGSSASMDMETRGPGSKEMRDNRLKLLTAVNTLTEKVATSTRKEVSLTIAGHSLGGSLSELFTSEVHQAIYHQNHKLDADHSERLQERISPQNASQTTMLNNVSKKVEKNQSDMGNTDFSALAKVKSIKTMAANSARMYNTEARTADGFVLANAGDGVRQEIRQFKVGGDYVSQASKSSLGARLVDKDNSNISVSLLKKKAGYAFIHPILGHCDHALRRFHDKNTKDVNFTFLQANNPDHKKELKGKLTSKRLLPKVAQTLFGKTPQAVSEPLTWARQRMGNKEHKGFSRNVADLSKIEEVKIKTTPKHK